VTEDPQTPPPAPAGAAAVSVVVATHDRPARLERLLDALAAQSLTSRFEVVVADDGGRPATGQVLNRWVGGERLSVRRVPSGGGGPAAARNAGWRLSEAPLVAFTDDDCEPDPGWLGALLQAAASAPGALIQGRTVPNPVELGTARGLVRTKSVTGLGPWFQTCNVLYPRSVLQELGGFDERFTGPFGEDADLAWRAIEAGVPAVFAPEASVRHAVEPLSAAGYLRSALRDPDEALVFKRHPALRRRVGRLGVFKSESHALLALALAGAVLARHSRPWSLLVLPYARLIAARTREPGHDLATAPILVAFDALETVAAARGALRHRVAAI
jgi:glycosyltransferase involved in cell wall biosynthesis